MLSTNSLTLCKDKFWQILIDIPQSETAVKMGTFGVRRASDESLWPSTLVHGDRRMIGCYISREPGSRGDKSSWRRNTCC